MASLLDVQGIVTPVCSQSHITYSFPVPPAFTRLNVAYSYDPKRLEDQEQAKELIEQAISRYVEPHQQPGYLSRWESYLPLQNLLTLSFDDPEQFRGAAHRHDPEQQLHIGMESASPGLVPGAIRTGLWRVTISMHAVVTEQCRYKLRVWGETER